MERNLPDWTHSHVVHERVDEYHGANTPLRALGRFWRDSEEADDQQKTNHRNLAPKVQGSPAKLHHQEPREDGANRSETILPKRHGEGRRDIQACLLEKVGGIASERRCTAKRLNSPDHAHDLSSPEVRPLEAVLVACSTRARFLQFICVDHHVDCFIGIEA